MRFTAPWALLLLVLLLPVFYWGRPGKNAGGRERLSLVLRALIVAALVFSLAGLEFVRQADELAVAFLIDASASMDDQAQAAAQAYVRQALEGLGPNDRAAVVVFGGDALVERGLSAERTLAPLASRPQPGHTDLGEAIRLGQALLPPEAAKRLVILSDGEDTLGEGEAAARAGRPARSRPWGGGPAHRGGAAGPAAPRGELRAAPAGGSHPRHEGRGARAGRRAGDL
jgi:hypothetical protein